MSSSRKRKGKAKFIMIEGYLKKTAAWKALTPVERAAYLEVKWRFDGFNNGRVGLGCRELADELNMGRDTANRALEGLVDKGFIVKAKPSAFHVKNRAVTEWRITEYKCDVTGDLPTKDFIHWTGEKKPQSHPSDTQSHPSDCDHKTGGQNTLHSRTHRTAKPDFTKPQSHPSDTYRYTIPNTELEGAVTALGELVQPLTKGEASKLTGQPPPTEKNGEALCTMSIPTRERDFTSWVNNNIPDPSRHREAYRLLREGKMTLKTLEGMAA